MKECHKNTDNGGDFYEKEITVRPAPGLLKLSFQCNWPNKTIDKEHKGRLYSKNK